MTPTILLAVFALGAEPAEAPTTPTTTAAVDDDAPASDAEAVRRRELREKHGAEKGEVDTENGLSARVLLGAAAVENGAPLLGAGIAYERDIAHGLMAIEVALEGLASPEASAVLLELVFEKPVELTETVAVYFGGGPTVAWHIPTGAQGQFGWGGLALIGAEYMLGGGFEVFLELDTAIILVDKPIVEADLGAGVMWRF